MAGCVATIGFFDGVHRGHRFVIGCVAAEARRRGLEAVVVTFDRHPREVVTGTAPPLLTTPDEKRRLIVEAGADRCEVLHFDRAKAALSARDFMAMVLRDRLGVKTLLLGYDNHFGHREAGRSEGFDDYRAYGRELGIDVVRLEQYGSGEGQRDALTISSSAIRQALAEGDVELANMLLGRRYSIAGRVVHGFGEGHRLGFPTANIDPESVGQMVPAGGVYQVEVAPGGLRGMMNIGTRPTYDGREQSLEVHVIGFDGDLYGRELAVSFVRRLREERRFSSIDDLRRQLEQDRAACWEEGNKGGVKEVKEVKGVKDVSLASQNSALQ